MPANHSLQSSIWKSYGLWGSLVLLVDLIYSRLLFSKARIVHRPIYIRGRSWIDFGERISTGRRLRIEAWGDAKTTTALIKFGEDVRINDDVHIAAKHAVRIGNRVLVASKVFMSDHNHGSYGMGGIHSDPRTPPDDRPLSVAPVVVEDDVWIGESVVVLPGATIGKGAVIGAMSTVTKEIPPYTIAVGNPARPIKRYNFETLEWERC